MHHKSINSFEMSRIEWNSISSRSLARNGYFRVERVREGRASYATLSPSSRCLCYELSCSRSDYRR